MQRGGRGFLGLQLPIIGTLREVQRQLLFGVSFRRFLRG